MHAESWPSFRRVWRDHQRALVTWSVALAAIAMFYMAFWPLMGEELAAAYEGIPEAVMRAIGYHQVTTAGGYMQSVVYGLLGPVLVIIYAVGLGGRILAGQEEDGTLELDLASPVSRGRLYWERFAAGWALATVLVAAVTVALLVSGPLFDLGVATRHILTTSVGLLLLGGGFFSITFAVGAATGRRGAAVGAGAMVATVTFVFRGVADAGGVDVLAALSPFSWLLGNEPLENGLALWDALRLAAITCVAAPLGVARFVRRDLMA